MASFQIQEVGQCKLCLKEKPLANSHVIPEFHYKLLYDEKGRAHMFTGSQTHSHKYIQKGLREPLLCKGKDGCEEIFSKWERYGSQVLNYIPIVGSGYDDPIVAKGIDYTPFKLYQMSILWRASVSKLPAFNDVQLGPHEERLRNMLLNSNPGEPYEFGCMMIIRRPFLKWSEQLISTLPLKRFDDHRVFRFFINGIIWSYFVSSHTYKIPNIESFISREGNLPFMVIPSSEYDKLVLNATKNIINSGFQLPRE